MMDNTKQSSGLLISWFIVWVIYTACYELAKVYDATYTIAGMLILFGCVIADILMIGFSSWLWVRATGTAKRIFGLFAVSFLCLLGVDFVYHILYTILGTPEHHEPLLWLLAYKILYVSYLLLQLTAWLSILFALPRTERRSIFLCLPVTIILLATFLIYIFAIQWNPSLITLTGFYAGVNEIFELIGFVPAALCFITSRNRGIAYLAFGYIFVMSAGFILDFNFFAQKLGSVSIIEVAWVLYAIFTVLGFMFIKNNQLYVSTENWVALPDSLRAKIAFWGLVSSVLAFVLLTIVAYCFNL